MRRMLGWVALIGLTVVNFVWWRSEFVIQRVYSIPDAALALSVSPSPTLLERGRHLTTAVAQCQFCHAADLGGKLMADDLLLGSLRSTNLTAGLGGIGAAYSDADWVRAIRFGVGRDGRSLALMPSAYLSRMTDEDLASLISYLKQVPPTDREIRSGMEAGVLPRIALSAGLVDNLMSAVASEAEGKGTPSEYLVDIGNCRICHRVDLSGGLHPLALPGEPVPPDLRPGGAMANWGLDDFERAMRSGRTPDGRQLDREYMPWPAYAALTDAEIESLWAALKGSTKSGEGTAAADDKPLPAVSAESRSLSGRNRPKPQAANAARRGRAATETSL